MTSFSCIFIGAADASFESESPALSPYTTFSASEVGARVPPLEDCWVSLSCSCPSLVLQHMSTKPNDFLSKMPDKVSLAARLVLRSCCQNNLPRPNDIVTYSICMDPAFMCIFGLAHTRICSYNVRNTTRVAAKLKGSICCSNRKVWGIPTSNIPTMIQGDSKLECIHINVETSA